MQEKSVKKKDKDNKKIKKKIKKKYARNECMRENKTKCVKEEYERKREIIQKRSVKREYVEEKNVRVKK